MYVAQFSRRRYSDEGALISESVFHILVQSARDAETLANHWSRSRTWKYVCLSHFKIDLGNFTKEYTTAGPVFYKHL